MHAVQYPSFPCLRIHQKQVIFSVSNPSFVSPSFRFPSITAPRMGWIWREVKHEDGYAHFWDWEDLGDGKKPCWSGFSEPLKKTIRSEQKTEEVEPGKFIQKRHNIMEIIRKSDGVVLESKTYDTEEEMTKEEVNFGPCPSNYHLEIPDFIPVPPPKQRPNSTTK